MVDLLFMSLVALFLMKIDASYTHLFHNKTKTGPITGLGIAPSRATPTYPMIILNRP